jgi:hypothetical protein
MTGDASQIARRPGQLAGQRESTGVPSNHAAHLRTSLPRRGPLEGRLPAAGHWRWPATGLRSRGSTAMTESERKSRNAVQEAMDRRDNGGETGH